MAEPPHGPERPEPPRAGSPEPREESAPREGSSPHEPAAREPSAVGEPPVVPAPAEPAVEPPSLVERARASPATFLLAAINVGVFLWAGAGDTTQTGTLLRFGAVEPLHVWAGEYWRVATCMFLHIGWIHLIWNTYASVGWCTSVEAVMGPRRFLTVYLLSGLAGGCMSVVGGLLFSMHVSAGASGAMFGIVGSTLAMRLWQLGSLGAFFADRSVRSTLVSIGIWTAIGLTALSMDNWAHLGGFLAGLATTLLFLRRSRFGWMAFAVALAALFTFAARPWAHLDPAAQQRMALYTYANLRGHLPGKDDKPGSWPANPARGIRFGEKACASGGALSCGLLGEYLAQQPDPASQDRARLLLARACELDPKLCADATKESPPDPDPHRDPE